MENSRRNFLKAAGAAALAVGAKPVVDAVAASSDHGHAAPEPRAIKGEKALMAKHWGMVINLGELNHKTVEAVVAACHKPYNVPDIGFKRHEIKWIWETEFKHAFPSNPNKFLAEKLEHAPILVLCNHCENPPCVRACPTKATFKRETDGVVMMDYHRCIGCRFCMAACPFGARSFNFVDPRPHIKTINKQYPTRMKGVVEKCTFCVERLAEGKLPACVEASEGAIAFGDLDDPDSNVRKLLREHFTIRRKEALGTEPSVYYIV
jgi:molybdopterin-containing oxidoreductase family iron-sulfur binding subunit